MFNNCKFEKWLSLFIGISCCYLIYWFLIYEFCFFAFVFALSGGCKIRFSNHGPPLCPMDCVFQDNANNLHVFTDGVLSFLTWPTTWLSAVNFQMVGNLGNSSRRNSEDESIPTHPPSLIFSAIDDTQNWCRMLLFVILTSR